MQAKKLPFLRISGVGKQTKISSKGFEGA